MFSELSEYFNSNKFYNILKDYKTVDPDTLHEIVCLFVGYAVNHFLLIKNIDRLDKSIKKIVEFLNFKNNNVGDLRIFSNISEKVLLDDLNDYLKEIYNVESLNKKEISRYIYQSLRLNGYSYHSFNSAFYEQIKNEGLSATSRIYDMNEVNEIRFLLEQKGLPMIMGWLDINSNYGFFIDSRTSNIYDYGTNSPEWFSEFVCGSAEHDPKISNKRAYEQRNYIDSKENLLQLLELKEVDNNSIDKVMSFFDKNWEKFGLNTYPMVALIPNQIITETGPAEMDKIFEELYETSFYNMPLEFCLDYYVNGPIDRKITKTINYSNIQFVKLPGFDSVLKRVYEENKFKSINSDKITWANINTKSKPKQASVKFQMISENEEQKVKK